MSARAEVVVITGASAGVGRATARKFARHGARIAQQAQGFIYAVSRAGVTGERDEMTRDAEALVKRVRSVSDLPVAVGFGISSPEQVCAVCRFADAAVVGSAIVKQIEKLGDLPDLVKHIGEFARSLVTGT